MNESNKSASAIAYAFDKIGSAQKETIKRLSEEGKSLEEINKVLEIQLDNVYKQGDAATKFQMNLQAMENQRAEHEKEVSEKALQYANARLEVQKA